MNIDGIIGHHGFMKIVEIELNKNEQAMFDKSVAAVKELMGVGKV